MQFSTAAGTPPPFQDPDAQLNDRPLTDPQKVMKETAHREKENLRLRQKYIKDQVASPHLVLAEPEEPSLDTASYIIPGLGGKPKGIKQVLYERGLWVQGMQGSQAEAQRIKLILSNREADLEPEHLDAPYVLSQQPDFLNEVTVLQEIYLERGHILFKSVICHPEYAWGKLKFE